MPANTSGFSRSQPSGSSSIRYGDDLLRSDKSILEETLNAEHYFTPATSASSASGGVHRPGSARIFSTTRASLATPASADSSDRLTFSTDLGSLHRLGASSHSTLVHGSKAPGAVYHLHSDISIGGSGSSVSLNLTIPVYSGFTSSGYTTTSGYTVASPGRIHVPPGYTGLHMIAVHGTFSDSTARENTLIVTVDGSEVGRASAFTRPGTAALFDANRHVNFHTLWPLSAGSIVEVVAASDCTTSLLVDETWIGIARL